MTRGDGYLGPVPEHLRINKPVPWPLSLVKLKSRSCSQGIDASATVLVIVQYLQQPADADHQKAASLGAQFKHTFNTLKSTAISMPAASLNDLASDPNVKYVSLDRPVEAKLDSVTAAKRV